MGEYKYGSLYGYDKSKTGPKFSHAKINTEEVSCSTCGWPLSVPMSDTGSVLFTGKNRGDRKYAHQRCPSLRERAVLRKQALVNA